MALTGSNQKWLGKFLGPITRCIDYIKCCVADILESSTSIEESLEAICEKLENLEFEFPEGTVFPTKDVLCTPDCQSVLCFTTFNPDGTVATITHVLPDGSTYEGDLNELDPTCAKCSEPTPTYEIITKDICLEDCTEGCIVLKVNTLTDEITLVNTLGQDGLPTELAVVPCPKFEIVSTTKCEL